MRVLLINPPTPEGDTWIREGRCQQWDIWGAAFPPYSLAMIARQLVDNDCEVEILDCGPQQLKVKQVIKRTMEFSPDLVVLSTASPTIENDLGWFATELRDMADVPLIAAIGIHGSALPEETLERYTNIDFVVIGEPEEAVRDLVIAVANQAEFHSVSGIGFRTENSGVHITKDRGFTSDLDTLGFPAWEKVDFSKYIMPIKDKPFSMINFSRGCPYECTYCATHTYNGRKIRNRSIDKIVDEIEYNLNFGVRDFLFWTELMTVNPKQLKNFLKELRIRGLSKKIRWVCNSRVDSADQELFEMMKDAGCWQIAFGFEFGSDEILRLAKKGGSATIQQGRIAAELANNAGIFVDGHFILGYPGETEETMQSTIDYACSLPLTFAHFYACVPFPGTTLYEEARRNDWLNESGQNFNQDFATLNGQGLLEPEVVQTYISKAYRRFYMRTSTVWKGLKIPSSPNELISMAKLGYRFYQDLATEKKVA